jgi:hypothetical protein
MDTGIIPPAGWYRSPKKGWFRWFKTKNRSEWVIVTPFGTFYQITNSPTQL